MIALSFKRVLSLGLLMLAGVCAATAQQNNAEPPLITVTGQAEVKVVPDMVVFSLKVESLDKDLETAKRLNDERARKVLAVARLFQISERDVQTDFIEIEPRYNTVRRRRGSSDEEEESTQVFIGYNVKNDIAIVLRDVSKTERLLSDVLKAGVSSVESVTFRSSEIRKYRDQARALAIRAAREKAVALTGEIGQRIGKAYSIVEGGDGNRNNFSNLTANATSIGDENRVSAGISDSDSAIALGQISITAQVTVKFIID